MKKLLFVMHTMGFGGAERSLVNLLYELPRDRYEVDILLFQKKGELISQLPEWVRVLDTPPELKGLYAPVRRSGKMLPTKLLGTFCARLARNTQKSRAAYRWAHFYSRKLPVLAGHYDVAACYGGSELMYYVADFVQADRKLAWIHSDYRAGRYCAEYDRSFFGKMDAIISISDICVDVLKEEFPEYAHKMHMIENITSAALLQKRAAEFVPAEYTGSCNFVSVGRLVPLKGFDMAIEAAAILKKKGLDFKWFVVGQGDLHGKLLEQIRQMDVEEHFVLLGPRSNPYPYMKHCTALIQPSRYEGKSMVLDEAKILGAPIVATAYPTVFDQIRQDQEGVITPMNGEAIAGGILSLVQCPQRMEGIRSYLQAQAYGNAAEVQKYIQIFEN